MRNYTIENGYKLYERKPDFNMGDLLKITFLPFQVILTKEVYEALVVDHSLLDMEFKKQLKAYRIDLNVKQSAWDKLNAETSLELLTGKSSYHYCCYCSY